MHDVVRALRYFGRVLDASVLVWNSWRSRLAFAASLVLLGCGGPEGTSDIDGGADASAMPTAPLEPELTPCPEGWLPAGANPVRCEPWPSDTPPQCNENEVAFPGRSCVLLGTPCTANGWASGLPNEGVIYVSPDAIGGSGTRDAPYGSVALAMSGANPGDVVALAAGTYAEDVRVPPGVTLWGACVSETIVSGAPGDGVSVGLFGDGATLRNLQVGGGVVAVATGTSTSTTIEDVLIQGVQGTGLLPLNGARVDVRRLVIRNLLGPNALGIAVGVGSRVVATDVAIANVTGPAIFVQDEGTEAIFRGLDIVGTGDRLGHGASADTGSSLEIRESIIRDVAHVGLSATAAGSSATLEHVVIRGVISAHDEYQFAVGLLADEAGSIVATKIRLEESAQLLAAAQRANLVITDGLLANVMAPALDENFPAAGVAAIGDAGATELRVERVLFESNQGDGLAAVGLATVQLQDVRFTRGRPDPDASRGRAMSIYRGAVVTGDRLALVDHHEVSMYVAGEGSRAAFINVEVRTTRPRPCATTTCSELQGGTPVLAAMGGAIDLERFVIADGYLACIHVDNAGIDLRNGIVSGCPVGAYIGTGDFDERRLANGVRFENIAGRNFVRESRPVPSVVLPRAEPL